MATSSSESKHLSQVNYPAVHSEAQPALLGLAGVDTEFGRAPRGRGAQQAISLLDLLLRLTWQRRLLHHTYLPGLMGFFIGFKSPAPSKHLAPFAESLEARLFAGEVAFFLAGAAFFDGATGLLTSPTRFADGGELQACAAAFRAVPALAGAATVLICPVFFAVAAAFLAGSAFFLTSGLVFLAFMVLFAGTVESVF